ncbi:MAG: LIC_13355 family lipoprotein [Sandaracinaceae bacterium]|nr:LIC_13355 family lipoprotein [Sandaracinaceae bacterium]
MRTIDERAVGSACALLPGIFCLVMGCAPAGTLSEACGDGALDALETCDDGNLESGDGCSAQCLRERAGSALADVVLDAPDATGTGFGDPARAINGVRGGGARMQSLDVYSIRVGPSAYLVLGWDGARLVDGPGDDLAVFENAFEYGEDRTFVDAAIVEVSADGQSWVALPHDYDAPDERVYSASRERWIGFAGVTPVMLHEEDNPLDPFEDAAGGDRFDLSALPPGPEADRVLAEGACCVRLVAAASRENPDTGEPFVMDPVSDGPDIDGVAARYLAEEP